MTSHNRYPEKLQPMELAPWWQVWLAFLLCVGVLGGLTMMAIPVGERRVIEIMVVLVFYIFLTIWLGDHCKADSSAAHYQKETSESNDNS